MPFRKEMNEHWWAADFTFCMTACTSSGFMARSLEKLSRERACQFSSTGSAKRAPSNSCSKASVLDSVAAWLGEAPLPRWALHTAETTESMNMTAASNWLCCSCIPLKACLKKKCKAHAARCHNGSLCTQQQTGTKQVHEFEACLCGADRQASQPVHFTDCLAVAKPFQVGCLSIVP